MKVKIGNLEDTVDSIEELDTLVARYGSITPNTETHQPKPPVGGGGVNGAGAADSVLLKKIVEAGAVGLTTIEVGTILGRKGKAARPALKLWAKRIGLSEDENMEVFEDARVGTQRGVRLKSGLLDVARHLHGQK
jgi:hypothetical protein